jgi:hypothetical protein
MKTDTQNIKVIANPQQNGTIEWRIAVGAGMAQGPGHYPAVSIDQNQQGLLTFTVVNTNTVNFDPNTPFTVQPATTSPTAVVGNQFTVTGGKGTQTMTVADTNQNAGDFYYALHMSNGDTVDPIIKNGGCCTGVNQDFLSSPLGIALEIAAVVLIIALIIWKVTASRRVTNETKGP